MKPVPISNKIANQWNEFLDYFNEKAYNILPKNGDKPKWELLDTNQGWDNLGYSGAEDFYQKTLNEFKNQKGYTAADDLTLEHIPVIQKHFDELANTVQSDPEYFNNIMLPMLRNVSNSGDRKMEVIYNPEDMGLYNSSTNQVNTSFASSGNVNPTGWVGSKSRLMRLPFKDLLNSAKSDKDVTPISKGQFVPASFNQGEPFYKKAKFGVINTMEYGGKLEDGGKLGSAEQIQATKKILLQNKDKEFVKRIFDPNTMAPANLGGGEFGTHLMEYASDDQGHLVYPRIVNINGKLTELSSDDAYNHAIKTGEFIRTPDKNIAAYISTNGYKEAAGWNKGTFEEGGELEEEVEVTGEGELEEVSEEISKAKGPGHEKGGIDLNTGDEIRGDETVNVKKGMVFSASLINPETNNPFAKDHEALAKQMKEVEGRTEKWAVKKLSVLKEKEHELFEKQQTLNGNNGEDEEEGEEMEDGGLTDGDPPAKAKSKVPQIRYFVANEKTYAVNPKKYDQFIKEFPEAKEYEKLSDNTLVEATSPLAKAGQKKNEPLSKAATTTKTTTQPTDGFKADWNIVKDLLPQEKVDIVQTQEVPDQLGGLDIQEHKDLYKEVIPLVEKIGANKFIEPLIGEQQKELIGTQNPFSKITTFGVFNDIIKDQIRANYDPETQKLVDQYGPEYERIFQGAARIIRDEENSFVGKKILEELYKQEQGILQYEKSRANEGENVGTIIPANVETSKGFDYSFEDLVSKFKGIKLTDEKGKVIDTNNITPSQLKEIEAYVKNSYQTFRNLKIEGDNLNKTVEAIANGKNEFMTGQYDENGLYVGEKMVKVDENNPLYAQAKDAIDQGIIPKDSDFWKGFLDKSNNVNQKYTKIYSDLQTTIDIDTKASKLALQKEDAEFTNSAIPRLEQAQADIQNKIDKGEISFEAGSLLLEQTESAINQQRTQIYDKWSKKINANIQQQMKLVNESYNKELKDMFTNSVYEGLDISKVDEQYINKSLQAFYGIVGEQVDKNLGSQYVQLNKLANDAYQLNPDWKIGSVTLTNTGKISTEFGRGILQMGESLGGLVSFLGGWELGNQLTDTYQQYNADNPQLNTGDIKLADFLNPDFYIANLVPSMPMAITFTGIGLITGGAAGGVAESIGASGVGKTIFQGVAGSFMETPLMALSEAGSDFTEQINNGVSVDVAANQAADTFAGNMSLWYMNVGQLMMAFTPLGKMKGIKSALLKAPAGIFTEGAEEVYQGHLTQHNPYQTLLDYAFSPMGKKEFVIGGVMGLAFSAPDVASTIAGKDDKFSSALMYDMLMAGDMATEYNRIKQGLDLMKVRDQIAPEKYDAAMQQLEFALLKGREIPENLKPEQKQNIFSILSDINKIEQVKATTTDPTLIKTYDKEIGALEKQVQETMAGTQPMYFIGRVSYPKDQFEQLIEDPDVAAQIINGETTVGVYNDDAVKSKIEALYDTENKNGVQGGIQDGQELVEGELDKGAGGEEISPSGVVQNEEGVVDITPEDQEFVDIFEEAKGYTGLRKIEAMDELKTKNSAKFAQVSFIDNNLDVIAEKLNIKKDCK